MVMQFTADERRYIDFDTWTVKADCPDSMRKKLEAKISMLQNCQRNVANGEKT